TVEEGLRRTVQWYLDNEDWWRPLQDRHGVGQRLGTGVAGSGSAVHGSAGIGTRQQ
ncbi:MAG: hypothetical protein H5U17_17950, partial [Defluviimonas sp.]|nr:hypothetical protein [Defluviimonas sp.]